MAEPTTRELYDIINAMRVDISVMSTKMDFVMDSKKTAERAESKADKALQIADAHEKEIEELEDKMAAGFDGIKKAAMWAIGLTVTALISLMAIILNVSS